MIKWYKNENCSEEKPIEIDKTSSKVFNYIRKDFVEVPAMESEDDIFAMPAHWSWMEAKVYKVEWDALLRSDIHWWLINNRLDKEAEEAKAAAIAAAAEETETEVEPAEEVTEEPVEEPAAESEE